MERQADILAITALVLALITAIDSIGKPYRVWLTISLLLLALLSGSAGTMFLLHLDQELKNPFFHYRSGFPDIRTARGWAIATVIFWLPLVVFILGRFVRWRR